MTQWLKALVCKACQPWVEFPSTHVPTFSQMQMHRVAYVSGVCLQKQEALACPYCLSDKEMVAEVLEYTKGEQLESLFQSTTWVFDDKYKRPGYAAFNTVKHAVSDVSVLDSLDLSEDEREVLINNINRHLAPEAAKIRADIEVACYGYEDIDAVKEATRAGLTCTMETMPVNVKLIALPQHATTVTTLERTEGHFVLNQPTAIKEKTEEKRGVFNVQMKPKVVTDTDEAELARQLGRLERENAEVDGDDGAEEVKPKWKVNLWATFQFKEQEVVLLTRNPTLKVFQY